MKRIRALVAILILLVSIVGCNNNSVKPTEESNSDCIEPGIEPVKYTCDLSKFPTSEDCMGYGEIKEIANGKLLISPGADKAKLEYGEVVWIICDESEAYSVGQVVTYKFRDVKAPDNEGEPLNIIAFLVYME